MNPTEGMDGAAYGYASNDWEDDFTMLSDIFPTAYHGCVLGEVGPGHSVAVLGGGPVGLLAVHRAFLGGASRVFLVDQRAHRLHLVKDFGADAIDFSKGDPVEQILDAHGGMVDRGVEAVGYQAHDSTGTEHPELVLDNLVKVVRATGAIGVVQPRAARPGHRRKGQTVQAGLP